MVKVKELLELPSLREATVLSGSENLHRSVTSLSFLEVSDMEFFSKNMQIGQEEYYNGELVIGSFYNIRNDIKKQCDAVRRLHALGEIGIILYYVGIILPEVSQELIETAETLGFIIICMPESQIALRYNEVIYEVMNCIIKQQSTAESFVNETLEKVSLLPEPLRGVETTLKLISDRLKANLVLTTSDLAVINQVMWPRNSTLNIQQAIQNRQNSSDIFVYSREIHHKDNGLLGLYVVKEKEEVAAFELEQVVEIIQVALNLWGKKHGEVSEYALVKAIINDESDKMYRLANILSIDVYSIEMMWLVHIYDLGKEKEIKQELEDQLSKFYQTFVVQMIDHCFVVLLGNYLHKQFEQEIITEYLEASSFQSSIKDIIFCPRMRHTTDVREMYQLVNQIEKTLPLVYTSRKIFSSAEIKTLQTAISRTKKGEQHLMDDLTILEPVREQEDLLQTLIVFLLEAKGSFTRCSEMLYVHKNTVKYRIRKISELLGYDVTSFAETYHVYIAVLMYKLLNI